MGQMLDTLERAKNGEITVNDLRSAHMTEYNVLGEAFQASEKSDGFMGAKDLLKGDNEDAKFKDFDTRQNELKDVENYLYERDRVAMEWANQRKALPERQFANQGPMPVTLVGGGLKSFGGHLVANKGFEGYDSGTLTVKIPAEQILHQLKAANFTGTSTDIAGGLLPSDRVANIYRRRVKALDYFDIIAEPGSIVRYHTPPLPVDAAPGDGSAPSRTATDGQPLPDFPTNDGARVRTRGARLGERQATWTEISLPKRPLGEWMPVNREDARDNPAVMGRVADQMMNDIRLLMLHQIFRGSGGLTGAGQQWDGLDPLLSGTRGQAVANIGAFGTYTTTSVAVLGSGTDREPLSFIEQVMAEMAMRGIEPTAIFLGSGAYKTIRQSQRVYRHQNEDYEMFPKGEVMGAALVLTPVLPANTLYICDTNPEVMQVVLGEQVEAQMSEDFAFADNAVALRVVVDGNIAHYQHLGSCEVTSTNNFVAASFS